MSANILFVCLSLTSTFRLSIVRLRTPSKLMNYLKAIAALVLLPAAGLVLGALSLAAIAATCGIISR